MLITAKVAWNQVKNKGRKEYRNSYIRELRRIEITINRAAKKGKSFVHHNMLSNKVLKVLEANGYIVRKYKFVDQKWVVISWNEPN